MYINGSHSIYSLQSNFANDSILFRYKRAWRHKPVELYSVLTTLTYFTSAIQGQVPWRIPWLCYLNIATIHIYRVWLQNNPTPTWELLRRCFYKWHWMDGLYCADVPLESNSTTRTSATNTSYEHHQRTKICHIPTSWHVEMLGSGIAMWQIRCRIVVSLSVGGVRSRCPCSGVWLLSNYSLTHFYKWELNHAFARRCAQNWSQQTWHGSWHWQVWQPFSSGIKPNRQLMKQSSSSGHDVTTIAT